MTRPLCLEDFGAVPSTAPSLAPQGPADDPVPEPMPQNANLEAFEQGYKSGWDDCIANETEQRRHVGAGLAEALGDVAASADDMRRELLAGLVPLFEQIATQLLPALAAEAVGPILVSELGDVARQNAGAEVKILAAPTARPIIENLVAEMPDLKVQVVPEPAFAEGQVSLRVSDQRRDVDLSDAAGRIAEAIRAFVDAQLAEGGSEPSAAGAWIQSGAA